MLIERITMGILLIVLFVFAAWLGHMFITHPVGFAQTAVSLVVLFYLAEKLLPWK